MNIVHKTDLPHNQFRQEFFRLIPKDSNYNFLSLIFQWETEVPPPLLEPVLYLEGPSKMENLTHYCSHFSLSYFR